MDYHELIYGVYFCITSKALYAKKLLPSINYIKQHSEKSSHALNFNKAIMLAICQTLTIPIIESVLNPVFINELKKRNKKSRYLLKNFA